MAQVSGVWVWNDSLPFAETAVAEYNLTFKSGNDNYTSLYVHDSDYDPRGGALLAYGSSGNAVYIGSGLETGFTNEVYKTIDFGTTPQTVSDNFYTYLTANATTTSTEQKAISLSNLEKFKELCDQTYAKTGGGSGGTQLYRHEIRTPNIPAARVVIISTSSTKYKGDTLNSLVYNNIYNIVNIFFRDPTGNGGTCIIDMESAVCHLKYSTGNTFTDLTGFTSNLSDTVTPL